MALKLTTGIVSTEVERDGIAVGTLSFNPSNVAFKEQVYQILDEVEQKQKQWSKDAKTVDEIEDEMKQLKQIVVLEKEFYGYFSGVYTLLFGEGADIVVMGEAIETATDGLRQENSVLVDNAGVTKNVAKMWKDYADTIGVTTNNLTQQQKIQAEVEGIMQETTFQMGDAARVAGTYQGQVASLSFALNNMKVAFGNFLKPIVQSVIPVIKTLVNWLTRLFNMLAQVSSILFGTSKSFSGAAKEQGGMASSGSAAADAQGDLAANTEKAGKAAKGALASFDDLNVLQQDTGSAGGAGSGGGDDGGGGFDSGFGEELAGLEINPKILDWIEKAKKLLEPTIEALKRLAEALKPLKDFVAKALMDFYEHFLKPVGKWVLGEGLPRFIDAIANGLMKIKWERINDALVTLWKALTPFTIKIGEGLLWGLENVLVPLGVWVMNEIVPVAIEIIAAAIELLTNVITALQPLALWLWNSFLLPIASWTGGVIVAVLGGLRNVLLGISNWVQNNQSLFAGMVVTLGAFFAAWKVAHLMAFIQVSGGVVGALAAVTTGLLANIAAKAADRIETIALTLTNARDFIVSLAQGTVELVKQAAQWVINTALKISDTAAQIALTAATAAWNIAAGIATTVTTAFGAAVAFLTSPIGIVVVAVTALIATIVLLVQNWDTVKEVAAAVWENIKEVWNIAAEWFRTTVVEPLGELFTNLWEGIKNGVQATVNFMAAKFEGVINGIISIFEKAINFMVDGLNKIKFEVPDWVPGIGGKSLGFDISRVSFSQVSIPRLATGTVVPPSKPFMAMLGDNTAEHEIVSPVSTMQLAFSEMMGPFAQMIVDAIENQNLTVTLDGELIYNNQQRIQNNRGTNLISGGGNR